MILTINIDNTITPYNQALTQALSNADQTENYAQQISTVYTQGFLRDLPVQPDSVQTLWNLNDQGHHIRLLVNRFIQHGQNHKVIAHTTEWLDHHDIPYREILFITKTPLLETDYLIDADPRTLKTYPHNLIKYETPENDHIHTPLTVKTWVELENLINTL